MSEAKAPPPMPADAGAATAATGSAQRPIGKPEGFIRRTLGAFDDRLNPILVKEMRQALKGRYFKATFWITLSIGFLVGILMLNNAATREDPSSFLGEQFFIATYACLAIGVIVFVPFWGFISMGNEWEENTFDLLVISNLRPRSIVLGKLFSTLAQALLFYSAFTPLLAFAFLLRGVDLWSSLFIFALSILVCAVLSLVSIALSTTSRARFGRVIAMVVLLGGLGQIGVGSIGFVATVVSSPAILSDPSFQNALGMGLTGTVALAGLAYVTAVARLAHPEENRSTGLRVLVTVVILASLGWSAHLLGELGGGLELLLAFQAGTIASIVVPMVFLVTEPPWLGRRVRSQVPKHPLGAFAAAPFLPGGGRGFLLLLTLLGLSLGSCVAVYHLGTLSGAIALEEGEGSMLLATVSALFCYTTIYLGLPSALLESFTKTLKGRTFVRSTIPVFVLLAYLIPTLFGLFTDNHALMRGSHLGNPVWVMIEVGRQQTGLTFGPLVLVEILCAITILLNLGRLLEGFQEVLACAAERRGTPGSPDNRGSHPEASSGPPHAPAQP